jgi:aryl-alcohol dehydrogenase-like predicted oxidoreductase
MDTRQIGSLEVSVVGLGCALARRREDVALATKFGSRIDEQRRGASASA